MSNYFLKEISHFLGRTTPERGRPIGYSLLIRALLEERDRVVPVPERLAISTEKQTRYDSGSWQVFPSQYRPKDNLISHVVFALKYEGLDLLILKETFKLTGPDPVRDLLEKEPTGKYSRRIWFLYEWLLDDKIEVAEPKAGNYVDVLDPRHQYPGPSRNSTRHRVRNNLPGTVEFCPLIFRTEKLEEYGKAGLVDLAERTIEGRDNDLIRRAAAFLLLRDSKASFEIEGEYPPEMRARNWSRAIGQAGRRPLSLGELERLQDIVIGSSKLRNMGLREREGFIGEHDRRTLSPIPDHISARAKDLPSLMRGLLETDKLLQESDYDPVLAAATIAFGFVFIHPFADGNGRIHRYLVHHILARSGYSKMPFAFPVSAAIQSKIVEYQDVLETFSEPRLDLIEWETDPGHNVRIVNETADLYRYFDLTPQAEFLYECIEETVTRVIPEELAYLEKYDRLFGVISGVASLPNTKADLLIKLLIQNRGKLSQRKRIEHFEELNPEAVKAIEDSYRDIFLEVP
ncbi:MAG: Fic family protein [Aridibacter famidurans]|nr:Fic family protein [Aridibacter famidurans]